MLSFFALQRAIFRKFALALSREMLLWNISEKLISVIDTLLNLELVSHFTVFCGKSFLWLSYIRNLWNTNIEYANSNNTARQKSRTHIYIHITFNYIVKRDTKYSARWNSRRRLSGYWNFQRRVYICCSVKTDLMEEGANSTLSIAKVGPKDSGNYTCQLTTMPDQPATVHVHVLNGEDIFVLLMYLNCSFM